jgi:hypothetical protein
LPRIEGLAIHPEVVGDIERLRKDLLFRQYLPRLPGILRTFGVGPIIAYSTAGVKFQELKRLRDRGIPGYHLVCEESLDGLRPMLLRDDSRGLSELTGIAVHRASASYNVAYDQEDDEQIERMVRIFQDLTRRE